MLLCFHTVLLLAVLVVTPIATANSIRVAEASIQELQQALSGGRINAVQLLAKHLHRIAHHDRRGARLNSIPVLNTRMFEVAEASDEYRHTHNGSIRSIIEGLPFTAKDSYMVKGLTVAAGSPAFQNLTASEDCFTVGALRAGGAIPVGKTNMPPMANGGMQRGLYGRSESPYNPDYLAAAIGSGSSNGCGVSTASGLAVFGLAEETVSSGRSPASNNGLVAYTPSRGMLSIRGNWPLTYSADVVVPHTRSVEDLFAILDVLAVTDEDTRGDFWRLQDFVTLPKVETIRPSSFLSLANTTALAGKRIAVPRMFIGQDDQAAQPVFIRDSVIVLWEEAHATLESLGAIVEEVDFPLVTNHEVSPLANEVGSDYPLPAYFNGSNSPGNMDAYAWDDFLHLVNDTTSVTTLADVDPALIFPQLPGTVPDRYGNRFGNRTATNSYYVEAVRSRNGSVLDIEGLGPWVRSLEARRQVDLEDWMDDRGFDAVVWPANGDVGHEAAEVSPEAAAPTWWNGVARSFGNFAIRQLGVPTVTVPMGAMNDTRMPVGLTFAGRAYDDPTLMSYAYAFEQAHSQPRFAPPRAPEIESDKIPNVCKRQRLWSQGAPILEAAAVRIGHNSVKIYGDILTNSCRKHDVDIEVHVDGIPAGAVQVDGERWEVVTNISLPFPGTSQFGEINVPDASLAMIVVVVTDWNGRSAGKLLFA